MKVLQINTVYPNGSTGKIAKLITKMCLENGIECKTAYRYREKIRLEDTICISSWIDTHIHNRIDKWTCLGGSFSKLHTFFFLKRLRKYDPDVIHIHNIHGNFINVNMLFRYIKKYKKPVIWTLHDCWSFTGMCPYFTFSKCDQWKSACACCPHMKNSLLKRRVIRWMFARKKEWFSGINNMLLVTPSSWLADLVKESFLGCYPVTVINNGIDLSIFHPSKRDNNTLLEKSRSEFIVLGVAFDWDKRKGKDVFLKLREELPLNYKIVLVGTEESIPGIVTIAKTNNQQELAEIYSMADVFVNPTREENYPTVNMEALACGTPVITFNTGGSPEIIDEYCGIVVECEDIKNLTKAIVDVCENKTLSRTACVEKAKNFDAESNYRRYIEEYMRMFEKKE